MRRARQHRQSFAIGDIPIVARDAAPVPFAAANTGAAEFQPLRIVRPKVGGDMIKLAGEPVRLTLEDAHAGNDDVTVGRILDRTGVVQI